MQKKRSIGVTILGVVHLTIFSCALIRFIQPTADDFIEMLFRALIIISPFIIASIGVLMLKNWARLMYIWLFSIAILIIFFTIGICGMGGEYNPIGMYICFAIFWGTILFFVSTIYFFTRPKVKQQFIKIRSLDQDN